MAAGGATITIDGFAIPGQVLNTGEFDEFSETVGSPASTEGGLTLNGVSYPVVLLDTPSFMYSSELIYNPGIVGPAYDPNTPRNRELSRHG